MGKITKVPNGPLIKKKGPYAGSTLKKGGVIKKAQNGDTLSVKKPTWQKMTQAERAAIKTKLGPEKFKIYKDSVSADASNRANAMFEKNAATRGMTVEELRKSNARDARKPDAPLEGQRCIGKDDPGCAGSAGARERRVKREARRRNGGPIKKAKAGAMIKRADGSYSQRGLWDNIRANKGSGKKPTKQMLVQEKKIKAKSKK